MTSHPAHLDGAVERRQLRSGTPVIVEAFLLRVMCAWESTTTHARTSIPAADMTTSAGSIDFIQIRWTREIRTRAFPRSRSAPRASRGRVRRNPPWFPVKVRQNPEDRARVPESSSRRPRRRGSSGRPRTPAVANARSIVSMLPAIVPSSRTRDVVDGDARPPSTPRTRAAGRNRRCRR